MKEGIREIIQRYFQGINEGGWEELVSDDMLFTMFSRKTPGKEAYLAATKGFLQVAKSVKVLQMIVENDNACAITRYRLESPRGDVSEIDIAEIFFVKNGKIKSNTIFFDTDAFNKFVASVAPK